MKTFLIPARYLFYFNGILLKIFSLLVLFSFLSARAALFFSDKRKGEGFLKRAGTFLFYNFLFHLLFCIFLSLPFAFIKPHSAIIYVFVCTFLFFLPATQLGAIAYFWSEAKPSFSIFFGFLKSAVFMWLAVSVLLLLCAADGFLIEPYSIKVTRITLHSKKIKKPLVILHLSDIQMDNFGRREKKLVRLLHSLHYDMAVMTGDFTNYDFAFSDCRRLFKKLDFTEPVFAVGGDADVQFSLPRRRDSGEKFLEKLFSPFRRENFAIVDGSVISEAVANGKPFVIAGVPRFYEKDVKHLWKKKYREKMKERFVILLSHSPDVMRYKEARKADLVLSGHTHGGQIDLPFYGALVTNTKLGTRYASGLFYFGSTPVYISRGIGMEGHATPKMRFFCKPEVVLITIKPSGEKKGTEAQRK